MRRSVLGSLLVLLALAGCTRPPTPVPVVVSPSWPPLLVPLRQPVTGQLLDAETRQPVAGQFAWANVPGELQPSPKPGPDIYRSYSVVADAQGYFALAPRLPAADTGSTLIRLESATHFGEGRWAPSQPAKILIHPYFRYQPDSCLAAADSVHFNPRAPLVSWWPSQLQAWLIHNLDAAPGRMLRTLRLQRRPLHDAPGPHPSIPFRLRIMAVDSLTGGPGPDLLTANVVLGFPPSGESYFFALWDYQIPVPAGSFYLGLETLIAGDKFYVLHPLENYRPVGPFLRAPCAFAATRTWTHPYNSKQGWQRLPAAQNPWPRYESIISLEISPR
ncbi:hypothetical protein EJV47_21080 [Hymenobacter gummosus]|uniref:Carboxypeptidase regulatory-like domain-containing protein n=1 Tax=Hymenobacter gummosus TaxID=1776032 RepID=A0A431TY56_9BACT|nr:hypothetical protein [Hymenobacter gummosus]RTQ46867.1 hypothetical protein EJV47_21080 [Hymenobacter gummosus]